MGYKYENIFFKNQTDKINAHLKKKNTLQPNTQT